MVIFQNEQKELRSQVDKMVAENKRLTRELKDSVQNQLTVDDPGEALTDGETLDDDQVLQNLQYQLQMALQVCTCHTHCTVNQCHST